MATYKIDPSHSEITFKVKHFVISTVSGRFLQFDATMTSDKEDFSDAQINFEADVNSVSTNDEKRDAHLKSDDFFSAEKYPTITFKSTSFQKKEDTEFTLIGDLTMHGVTKPVTLKVEHGGNAVDHYGNTRDGFEITGKLDRKDFDLKWQSMPDTGGLVTSDEIRLAINVEMIKQA